MPGEAAPKLHAHGVVQAFDCGAAGQQAVEAALGAYAAGGDPSAVLLPGLPGAAGLQQQQQQGAAADGQYVPPGAGVPYLTEELAQAVAQVPAGAARLRPDAPVATHRGERGALNHTGSVLILRYCARDALSSYGEETEWCCRVWARMGVIDDKEGKGPIYACSNTKFSVHARVQSLPEQQPQPAGPPQLPSPSLLRGLLGAEPSPSGAFQQPSRCCHAVSMEGAYLQWYHAAAASGHPRAWGFGSSGDSACVVCNLGIARTYGCRQGGAGRRGARRRSQIRPRGRWRTSCTRTWSISCATACAAQRCRLRSHLLLGICIFPKEQHPASMQCEVNQSVDEQRPAVVHCSWQGAAEDKDKVCAYIDTFTTWQPDKRVEQYALLHFDWDVAGEGEKWRAVLSRMDKALSSDVAP